MAYPQNSVISRLSKSPNSMSFCINSVFSLHAQSWEKARGSSGMIIHRCQTTWGAVLFESIKVLEKVSRSLCIPFLLEI